MAINRNSHTQDNKCNRKVITPKRVHNGCLTYRWHDLQINTIDAYEQNDYSIKWLRETNMLHM